MTTTSVSPSPPVARRRAFTAIFLVEMWERFGFYGMQALIIYFMIQRLGFSDTQANLTWGAFTALLYSTPALGGWIGDTVLGARRTMILGAIVLTIGYFLISLPTTEPLIFYIALGTIISGNGLFKSNAGNLIREIYTNDDAALDSAFTLYYMAINIGSTVSMFLTPWINSYVNSHYPNNIGWHVAFAASTAGLLIGLSNYVVMRHSLAMIGNRTDGHFAPWSRVFAVIFGTLVVIALSTVVLQYQSIARLFVYAAGVIVLSVFAHLIHRSERAVRAGLIITLILTVQVIGFYIFYQQLWTSMSLFTLRNVNWHLTLGGMSLGTLAPGQFQALSPLWIMILSPLLAMLYTRLGRRQGDFSVAAKFVFGYAMIAAGFFICGTSGYMAVEGKVSPWVMVASYGCCSLGEILINGLGLAMISRYAPARLAGFMMGAYYVAAGIAQYLGSLVASIASVPDQIPNPLETLPIYTALFQKLGVASLGCTLFALLMLPIVHRLERRYRTTV